MAMIIGIRDKEFVPIEVKKEDVPDADVLNVIRRCLVEDPKKRMAFKDIEKRLSAALEKCNNDVENQGIGETKQ